MQLCNKTEGHPNPASDCSWYWRALRDFSRKTYLKSHRISHDSYTSTKCNQCGKNYKAKRSLKEHIQKIHWEKQLKCDECEKMFSTTRCLNHHKRQVHVLKSFKCDQCKYRAKTKWRLAGHIKIVHDGLRDISAKCDLCGYKGTRANLKFHKESIHRNKKNWFCKA